MLKALVWCWVALGLQLALLHYVDRRVAAMPRLGEEVSDDVVEGLPITPPGGELDA